MADTISSKRGNSKLDFSVVSNPEFLREGSAIGDFTNPDRVVLGSLDREAAEKVARLYDALRAPILITDLRTRRNDQVCFQRIFSYTHFIYQ